MAHALDKVSSSAKPGAAGRLAVFHGRVVLLAGMVAGCTLVDQNTFNPHAKDAPVIPPAPVVAVVPAQPGPPPLLVITSSDPAQYGDAVRRAVTAARARKPDVVFDVVEIRAPTAPAELAMGQDAANVARLIVAQGVPATRVRLIARPDGGASGQVRVFVR